MKKEFKFLFSFLIISSFLYILISIFYDKNLPIIGTLNVAIITNKILNFFNVKTLLVDDNIYLPNNNILNIIVECTGIYEMVILSSIIISFPTDKRNKLFGVILGIIIIYILNLVRLISIAYFLIFYKNRFDFIDKYLWQVSLVIFISLAYLIWLKLIGRSNSSLSWG